ncbi:MULTISPECIES: gamma-glutamyltransferase [Thermomonospora]|uniref:Glutathione hydrolase proenzyme n=1 Tax=Thermomonospora curvata (strain ATCC 19995 / DSM 43183 / JCM 3096 / KCTC 9072 / NBRC 15933 / NCIMB 10081 / Henssen B9) TaxID=471852 RepID=D1A940_THECD|nr:MULTISPECIES: gamma-glutamyltransferase [Thermomonospora]ACY98678.1 gamma-glutamyltransferase [Thermomonospora curvata DSM 43183]PKK13803.1 MAG: gamma-glutamyltransferase [Thermomonospora sp. CIF 1]
MPAALFRRSALAGTLVITLPLPAPGPAGAIAPPSPAERTDRRAQTVATGYGGAVSTVDADASRTAIEVLRQGGNAADAAVAAAATLGVTEPYVAALGGGGFFVYYDARTRRVHTVDGRETAPAKMHARSFVDPATGRAIPFEEAVTSGLSVGVPGTVAQWQQVLDRFGTRPLGALLRPAIRVAERGFVVDREFHEQTALNADRFAAITPTRKLFLPGGRPPAVGSRFRNPDLARTYRTLARRGPAWFYRGEPAREIVRTVRHPPVEPTATRTVRPGLMELSDLAAYRAPLRPPTRVTYRGLEVYGMAPPSSGGSTVGEALNILDRFRLDKGDPVQALHYYLEASRLAYADRGRYIGDPDHVDVPLRELLSRGFARERACLIDPGKAAVSPVPPGSPDGDYRDCEPARGEPLRLGREGPQTTHLVVADRWGNVASYTITIEQFGGSGLTVPGRGFLLNNELTDFTMQPPPPGAAPDPNLPGPGKRPRSSMAPTIVLKDGRPLLALGSPGGSTIITTVLQILLGRIDLGMDLPAALAAPRATQRNTPQTFAEQAFLDAYGPRLRSLGHELALFPGPPAGQIGAATALEFLRPGLVQAVAEPHRRHGGSAMVVRPAH